jgi:hypothetical protein
MRGLLLASVAMMAGPGVPPKSPPPPAPVPERPCPEDKGELRPVTPDKPSDAQRFNPGLF